MAYPKGSLERFVISVHTDQKTWTQLLPFGQPKSDEHPSRFLVVAVFVSMATHAFLVYLLCTGVADRTTVIEPTAPSIDVPLIVSLVSLPTPATAFHDGLDDEVASAVQYPDQPVQHFQSLSERPPGIERKSEADSVMMVKDHGIPGAVAPAGKSPATDATPSIDVASAYHITREVVRIPGFDAEIVLTSKDQGVPGPEAPPGKAIATGTPPSIDLEAVYSMAREFARTSMTDFEVQELRFKSRTLEPKNHLGTPRAPRPDCRTVYAGAGLLAIPFLLKDTVTDTGCTWGRQEKRALQEDWERQRNLGRQKDQERLEFMSNLMNDLIFGW